MLSENAARERENLILQKLILTTAREAALLNFIGVAAAAAAAGATGPAA